jgi:glycosyltransferase involved in cell wall biosynthesis
MTGSAALRAGIVCDLLEERWPSMDLVADELMATLPSASGGGIVPVRLRPTMPRWPGRLARATGLQAAVNANRYLDRHRRYPRWLGRHAGACDVYHVIDHTYAHLVRELPAERTIVTCHDVDAFRSLVEPERERRSGMFRRMTARLVDGLRRAAMVTCDSEATRDALVAQGLRATGLEVVRLGVHPAFRAAEHDLVTPADSGVTLLHVGSTIPRKRIDLLLRIFARVREFAPDARLVRVGGAFTAEQAAAAEALGVAGAVTVMPMLSREAVAEQYRKATLVVLPSDAEGFGLPLVEAMASGTPVVASDLPVLREVGGGAATYAPVGDTEAWTDAIRGLLSERATAPARWMARRRAAAAQVRDFTWDACAARMAELYREVARG